MRCGAGSNPGSSVYNGKGLMKTIAYIDGFNLHYGLLRETRFLWLDLEKLVQALLTDKYEVQKIKYFTARIRSDRFSVISPHDQSCYLEVLSSKPRVKIIEGYYRTFRAKLPFAKEPCTSCGKVKYATVWKTEEKKSDVNLAVEMVSDAYENNADAFVLVSGDADHSAALSVARHLHHKTTVVFNPHEGECAELRRFSTFYKNIPRDLPARCQLPDVVPLPNGRTIHRPSAWR